MKPDLDEMERLLKAEQFALNTDEALALIADLRAKDRRLDAAVKLLQRVERANADFRNTLPPDWESDPLNDVCVDVSAFLSPKENEK